MRLLIYLQERLHMNLFKVIVINCFGFFQVRYALFKVRCLKQVLGAPGEKICQALEDVLTRQTSPEEAGYINKIEHLRCKLMVSDRHIVFTDYGAGAPNIARTEAESHGGVTTTKLLSEVVQWSKPFFWGLFLFKLIRQFAPKKCLELGTCLGISGSYMASSQSLSGNGELTTLEGDDTLAAIAKNNFEDLGLKNVSIIAGRFLETLGNVLQKEELFDFVFIDGHHDEEATLKYFNQILPSLSDGAVVIFDDIALYPGMKRAWKKLKTNGKFTLTADLSAIGVCIVGRSNKERCDIKIPLWAVGTFLKFNSTTLNQHQ